MTPTSDTSHLPSEVKLNTAEKNKKERKEEGRRGGKKGREEGEGRRGEELPVLERATKHLLPQEDSLIYPGTEERRGSRGVT